MSEEWSFEKDDFLTTTPYEALYAYHKEPFTHAAKMEELAAYSVSKGFKGFKTMYKKYVESLKALSGTIYIDNVTNFTNQPLELNAGDWEADDSGIFKKNGYNDEVACPHPIMPVERLVNIDTGEEKLQLAFRKGTIWRKIIVSKTVLASSNKVTELRHCGDQPERQGFYSVHLRHGKHELLFDSGEKEHRTLRLHTGRGLFTLC